MTLIVAIPAKDGVAFGSDSQVTTGAIRSTATKIHRLTDKVLWAASGELAMIQRVSESIEGLRLKNQPLMMIRDQLAHTIKNALESLLRTDFRTQFFLNDPAGLMGLHAGDFLFVEFGNQARILHVATNGTAEWITSGFAASGIGDPFAHALLHKYESTELCCEHAKLLAYKVIEEAIEVGAYGLGPPIGIWEATSRGVRQTSESERAGLQDSARLVREKEVELLVSPRPSDVQSSSCQQTDIADVPSTDDSPGTLHVEASAAET